jgi:omega-amidase
MNISVSLIQMDVVLGRPDVNLARVREGVRQAVQARAGLALAESDQVSGPSLIVLPELWGCGYDLVRTAQHADELGEGLFAEMATLAKSHCTYLAGSLLERRGKAFFNTAVLYDPQGVLRGHYRKTHLFRLMDEKQYLRAGDAMPIFELPWGRTALAICYDLRFPELFRHYALEGVVLIVIPSQWPARRVAHWKTLLRARAIENQMVVAGCNRVGQDGDDGVPFGGHSAVYDAWGRVVVEGGGDEETVLTGMVDLDTLAQARSFITVFEDRRSDLYG